MKKLSPLKKIKLPFLSLLFFILMFSVGLGKTIMQVFFLISFHELFHIVFALWFRYDIASIIIYPFGLGMYLEGMEHKHSLEEIVIAMAGLFSYVFSTPILWYLLHLEIISLVNYQWMTQINTSILLFNALPIYPLDGGRMIHGLMHIFLPYTWAKRVTILISVAVLGVFSIMNIKSMSMLLIVLFFLGIQLVQAWWSLPINRRQFYLYRYLHGCNYKVKKHRHKDLFRNYKNLILTEHEVITEEKWLHQWMRGTSMLDEDIDPNLFHNKNKRVNANNQMKKANKRIEPFY